MKSILSHSRKDQIVINVPIDEFTTAYFKIISISLENSYIFDRQIYGSILKFKGSICRFAWNGWNLFNTISGGEIEFSEENGNPYIRHKIYFIETLTIAILFHIIPLFTLKFEPKISLYLIFVIWILYAINYFVSVFRFNSFISEMLIKVNWENGYRLKTDKPAFG